VYYGDIVDYGYIIHHIKDILGYTGEASNNWMFQRNSYGWPHDDGVNNMDRWAMWGFILVISCHSGAIF
jgi:hypothetical protein